MKSPSKYYASDLKSFFNSVVPKGSSFFYVKDLLPSRKYDYLLFSNTLAYTNDVQNTIENLASNCHENTRVVVVYFNFLWRPLLRLAVHLGLHKKPTREPNWLTPNDFENIFKLGGFEQIKNGKRFIFPLDLGIISVTINRYLAHIPIINTLCLTSYQIFSPLKKKSDYSVSIIVPARNEQGNIDNILKNIPQIGKKTEVIFVEGHSNDNTYEKISQGIKELEIKINTWHLYKQKGIGKADAVKLGLSKAKNDIIMILDADLTVNPKDLIKFYKALSSGICDFANGSRLVYPVEKQAMLTLNYLGNYLFSRIFSHLIGQNIKDTLCGTKAFFRKDYQNINKLRKFFGNFDPFGDFFLLFGASKLNLLILDIPVRYKKRVYGQTNIKRFSHGWLLFKMTLFAARKIKYI